MKYRIHYKPTLIEATSKEEALRKCKNLILQPNVHPEIKKVTTIGRRKLIE